MAPLAQITPELNWLHTTKFHLSAPDLAVLPAIELPEIAFVGRSNAGKSTAINALTQQRQLAFASKKPGRTQDINLFSVGHNQINDSIIADLPGYGYAAVTKTAKQRWQQVMTSYLINRANLIGVVMLCDSRHGIKDLDDSLLDIIRPRLNAGLKLLILLTKADKLTRSAQSKILSITKLQVAGAKVQLFSALKNQGLAEAATDLWHWVHPQN